MTMRKWNETIVFISLNYNLIVMNNKIKKNDEKNYRTVPTQPAFSWKAVQKMTERERGGKSERDREKTPEKSQNRKMT